MERKRMRGMFAVALLLVAGALFSPVKRVQAEVKIRNERYQGFFDKKIGAEVTCSLHDIVEENEKERIDLVRGATSWNLVLNDTALYYSKGFGKKAGIYTKDTKTTIEKEVLKGKNLELLGGIGDYLFLGEMEYYAPSRTAGKVYTFHLKTGKKKLIDRFVGWVNFFSERAVMLGAKTDVSNTDLKLFSKNGKKLFGTKALDTFCYKGKIYYSQVIYNDKDYSSKMKYYSVDKNGKNRKKITEEEFDKIRGRFAS